MRITGMKLGIGIVAFVALGGNGLAAAWSILEPDPRWNILFGTLGTSLASLLMLGTIPCFVESGKVFYESKPKLPRAEAREVE
jgi:hypothetical protein